MTVGARIKKARQAAGLTQVELAARLGVEQSTISRWESDHDLTVGQLAQVALATLGTRELSFFFIEEEEVA